MNERPSLVWIGARGLAGFILSYVFWLVLILPTYTQLLAAVSGPIVRATERDPRWHTQSFRVFETQLRGRPNIWKDYGPVKKSFPMNIEAESLHWNIFVLLTLFIALPPSWRPGPLIALLAFALALLFAYHLLGVVIWSKVFYAKLLVRENAAFQKLTEGYYTSWTSQGYVPTWRGGFYQSLAHFHSQWGNAVAAAAAWAATHGLSWKLGRK